MTSRDIAGPAWVNWGLGLFILWFGSYAYLYVFSLGGPKPLYSYFALLGLALAFLVSQHGLGGRLQSLPAGGVRALLAWLLLYLAYGAFEFMRSVQDGVASQALVTLCEAVLLTGAFAVLMTDSRRIQIAMAALALLALVGAVIGVWDFFDPIFSNVPGRGAGLYVNPNIAGNFIAFAMVGGIQAVPRRFRLAYLVACGVGVLVTFSREAWIIWGVGTVWLGSCRYLGGTRRRTLVLLLLVAIGGGFTALLFAGRVGSWIAGSALQSYLTPNTSARLGIGASVLSGYAAVQRESLISTSLGEAATAPWIGHGLGYTEEWRYPQGPHDMYLLFLVEGGAVGVALYAALILLLCGFGTGIGRAVAAQIALSSFFTHNHLEQPAILIMIAFVFAHGVIEHRQAHRVSRELLPAPA